MEEQTAVLSRAAEMPPIQMEANTMVTHARPGYSMHNFGLAFYVASGAGKPVGNVSDPVWQV
jgi:hypothetical protein